MFHTQDNLSSTLYYEGLAYIFSVLCVTPDKPCRIILSYSELKQMKNELAKSWMNVMVGTYIQNYGNKSKQCENEAYVC